MFSGQVFSARALLAASVLTLAGANASAAVSAVGPGAFPGSSLLVDLTGLVDGTEVNGLSVSGVTFSYSLGNGNVVIGGGPGITGNVAPPNIVSTGDPSGVLSVLLPGPSSLFGYGYALLNNGTVVGATTITLFNGATNVGSLSYLGVPDPVFAGGFAGISSTLAFNRVQMTFNSVAAPFAADNFRVTAIPEPATWGMFAVGIAALVLRQQRRKT